MIYLNYSELVLGVWRAVNRNCFLFLHDASWPLKTIDSVYICVSRVFVAKEYQTLAEVLSNQTESLCSQVVNGMCPTLKNDSNASIVLKQFVTTLKCCRYT